MSNMNLPIGFAKYRSDDGREWSEIFDCDDNFIAKFVDPDRAAQVVRCVNNHDALVAALETVLANAPEPYCAITRAVDRQVREALAAARGEL